MLKNLGYDVEAPILRLYDWPGPASQPPFLAQKRTAALMSTNERAYVLNDMGTGKTRALLWAWDFLHSKGECNKLLIVAPLSTLSFVWSREIFNVLPHRKCIVLHGSKTKRQERLAEDVDIYIINHDGIKVMAEDLLKRTDIDVIGIDELAVFRNGRSGRTKTMRAIANAKHVRFRWGMTGSPMPTSPTDVWGEASIVTPGTIPKYFTRFRDELMNRITQFKFVPKHDAVQRAFAVLQPAVRFTMDDVKELPEYVERTVEVPMSKKQLKVYKDVAAACYAAVENKEITAANAGAAMNKLLQVSTGWVYTAEKEVIALDNANRVQTLLDEVTSTYKKCLVFVPFKHALAGVSAAMTKAKIDHAVVSGDTPTKRRTEIFTAFQNTKKYHAIVAHPQCLAHGVTLTEADTVIWFAPITSLEIYEQANRRIRRVGQEHKQLFLHIQGSAVEKRIYNLLRQHQQVQNEFLHLFEEATNE